MSRYLRLVRCLTIILTAAICLEGQGMLAQQIETPASAEPVRFKSEIATLALIDDVQPAKLAEEGQVHEPLPFASSVMTNDSIPPFAAHPNLNVAKTVSFEQPLQETALQYSNASQNIETVDDRCRELTAMIAGNLDSNISTEAKARMIETALRMVAQHVALKAEAEITQLKADHALEVARMNGQMMHMRSVANAADQINRVAGPLYKMLEKNYRQSAEMSQSNQQVAQMVAQIGMNRLDEDARLARQNRERITLTSPHPKPSVPDQVSQQSRAEQIMNEIDKLKRRLDAEYAGKLQRARKVLPATYNQPLQPRRQPLEPVRRKNEFYKGTKSQANPARSSIR